jgi:hypothetical protein
VAKPRTNERLGSAGGTQISQPGGTTARAHGPYGRPILCVTGMT